MSSDMRRLRAAVREPVWSMTTAALRPTASARVLPDYVIIGAQRCGTTALQDLLTQHPGIKSARFMKGVHYFDTAYDRGPDWYRTHFHTRLFARRFESKTGTPLVAGEASPYYLFHPLALDRIGRDLPHARVIVLLRDPVERTISHHKHEVRRGNESLSLELALEAEPDRLEGEVERIVSEAPHYNSHAHQTFSYVSRSMYADQIQRLFSLFAREQVLVLQSERFYAEPTATYRGLLDFIGVAQSPPPVMRKQNATPDATVPDQIRQGLRERFAGPNQRLFSLLGEEYAWQ